jgi:hypothetical protein
LWVRWGQAISKTAEDSAQVQARTAHENRRTARLPAGADAVPGKPFIGGHID